MANNIILASGSPRRKELLALAGLSFNVVVSEADESIAVGTLPEDAVKILSERKALAVKPLVPEDSIIVAADTVVALDDIILGKPVDKEDAVKMLCMLSGKTHSVFTGVTVLMGERKEVFSVKSDVSFYPLTKDEIINYVNTGEPLDKAGAYGIQGKGSLLVEKIDGDYFNIVGLPIAKLIRVINSFL